MTTDYAEIIFMMQNEGWDFQVFSNKADTLEIRRDLGDGVYSSMYFTEDGQYRRTEIWSSVKISQDTRTK